MDNLSALFLQNPQLAIALRRRAGAEGMIKEGTSSEPIRSPWQGINRLANALLGGYEYRKSDEDMKAASDADAAAVGDFTRKAEEALAAQLMGQQPQPGAQPAPASAAPSGPAPSSAPGGPPIAATMLAPEAQAFLTGVYGAESPGYNVKYGGSTFDNFADHPRTPIPIMSGPMKGQYSTAAGRPQFLASTWDDVKTKYNLPDFSPVSQDMGAWHLANDTYKSKTGRDLLMDLRSNDPAVRAGIPNALAGVWPSLPGGNQQNPASNGFWNRYNAALGAQQQGAQYSPAMLGADKDYGWANQGGRFGPPDAVQSGVPPAMQSGAPAPTGAQMPPGAPVNAPAAVPRETPPAAMGGAPMGAAPAPMQPGAVPGIPTRPQAGEMSALQRLYMSGMASNNPRVRAMAQGLAPFMKQENAAPIFQERSIGNDMVQRVVSYDQGRSWQPFDAPSRKFAPRQPIQMGNQMYNPDDPTKPIGPAPTPSTAEGMAMQGATIPGQGAPSVSQAVTELKTAGELGGVYAKRAEETMTAGDRARGQMVAIQQLNALGQNIQTGALAPAKQQIANLANSLGVDLTPFGIDKNDAGISQAYNAIVNKLVQSSIGAAQGFSTAQFSNKDLEFVTGQQARLANDPVGNTIILQSGRAIAERTAAKADALTEYLAGGGKNIAQFERDWNAKMKGVPLFQQVTPEQFQGAPPGVYAVMKPDGKDWDVQIKGVQQQAPAQNGPRIRRWNPETGKLE